MKRTRVAVIGCGSVSTQYLPHVSKCPHAELVSACDAVPGRAEKRAKEYGIPHFFDDEAAFFNGPAFDLLLNLTDMQQHGRINRRALEAGRNVWSEKPLASTYGEGRELLEFARSKGLRLWGAPAVVNSPQFAFMARAINEGKLGQVAAAHGHYGHMGPEWSAFFYEKDGGSLPDLAVYNLATLTGLLGPVKTVVAMLNTLSPKREVENRSNPVNVVAEDNAMVLMEHVNGALSHVQSGFHYYDPHGHEGKGQTKPTVSIVGNRGNMHLIGYDWSPHGVILETDDGKGPQTLCTDPKGFVWQEGGSVVAEALATGTEPLINCEHALHVLEIIEAARESQASGRRVTLKSSFKYPLVG
ncbi:MAG: Gfo/Idh/MocA family oxidoreductase [Opitutaceae bacterium]|nr:Gfo/Idh/MocA family oxidoreductase [Opitutaceae bacterium]